MNNHKKWLLSVILFSTLLLPFGVQAQDGETEVTETEPSRLVTTQASGWKYEGIAWSVE